MTFLKDIKKNPFISGGLIGLILLLVIINISQSLDKPQDNFWRYAERQSFQLEHAPTTTTPSPTIPQTYTISVEPGDTLDHIIQDKGISKKKSFLIIKALSKHLNPRKIKVNQKVNMVVHTNDQKELELLKLSIPKNKKQHVEVILHKEGYYHAKVVDKELQREAVFAEVKINSSLYADAQRNKVPYAVLRQLIAAYSYDTDFQRDVKKGDSFTVFYEKHVDPDTGAEEISNLLYANLVLKGKEKPIYFFECQNGSGFYFANGQSVKKQFMCTPVNGARISSNFGMRIHPIHGYSRMHKGVDFAARRGTEVMAASSGRVKFCGWVQGYGRYVEIDHRNGYSTAYAHLDKFTPGLCKGKKVNQGQVIAYVGSTGNSTGPHLHFELKKNGVHINPRSKNLPAMGGSLTGGALAQFKKHTKTLVAEMNKVDISPTVTQMASAK